MTITLWIVAIIFGCLGVWAGICGECHRQSRKNTKLVLDLIHKTISGEITWMDDKKRYVAFKKDTDGSSMTAGYVVGKRCSFISGGSVNGKDVGRPVYLIRVLKRYIRERGLT